MDLLEKVSKIDPENITVETVRILYPWTPRWFARLILATGVRRGEFIRKEDGSCRLAKGTLNDCKQGLR